MSCSALRAALPALLIGAASFPGALAQPPSTAPKGLTAQVTLTIPAGARTAVISRGNAELSFAALPAGLRQLKLTLSVSAGRYTDRLTLGNAAQTQTTWLISPFALSPLKGGSFHPALNNWKLLWNSTQPSTSRFTFTLNGQPMQGQAAATPFKVQVLFSPKTPAQLGAQTRLRPPRLP